MSNLKNPQEIDSILSEAENLCFFEKDEKILRIQNIILKAHSTLESCLNWHIGSYYFSNKKSTKDKANHFWINVLVDINFSKKIKICQAASIFSKETANILDKINTIRNDVAHYPNRIHKRKKLHLCYNGKNVYKNSQGMFDFCLDFKKEYLELLESLRKQT